MTTWQGNPDALQREQRSAAFARALSDALRRLGISHRSLADTVGVSVHTIASWTRSDGAKLPGEETLRQLGAVLDGHEPGAGRAVLAAARGGTADAATPVAGTRALATTFVGREALVAEVFAATQAHRLVTLTGVGGVGKTRLAAQVASLAILAFDDGAAMVELAPISAGGRGGASLVADAIAAALEVRVPARGDPIDAVLALRRDIRQLLILDNCEHVLGAAATAVRALLAGCPGLRILATSREPLRLADEHVLRAPPLSLPDPKAAQAREGVLASDAAQLFITRAMSVRGGFRLDAEASRHVAEIVRRLDGLPLAIELAAALSATMPLSEIATRLDDRFRLLVGGGAPESHHRTLGAAMAWSYDLLNPAQQVVLQRMAVFRGGWDLGAAQQVAGDRALTREPMSDVLTSLFEKSLIQIESTPAGPRYVMLETVREYALGALSRTTLAREGFERHAKWAIDLAEETEPRLRGHGQMDWFGRLDLEHANLRAALNWLIDEARDAAGAARLAAALRTYWQRRARYREGADFTARVLAMPGATRLPAALRGGTALCAGIVLYYQARYRESNGLLESARDAFASAGLPREQAAALFGLAQIAMYHDRYDDAVALADQAEALSAQAADPWGAANAQLTRGYAIGRMARTAENTAAMRACFDVAREAFAGLGDRFGLGAALNGLGGAALHDEDYEGAERYYRDSVDIHRQLDDLEWASRGLNNLGICARGRGDDAAGLALFREALQIREGLGALFGIATLRFNIGDTLAALGDLEGALTHLRESIQLNLGYNDLHGLAQGLAGTAAIWLTQTIRVEDAARLLAFSAPHLGYPGEAGGSENMEMGQRLTTARAMTGDAFDALAREGASLSPAEAASLALT